MLQTVDMSRNILSGKVPEWIGDLSKLSILVLRENNLDGEIPIQVGYLQNLQILDLAMNHLSGSIPPQLSNLSIMANENFTRSMPADTNGQSYRKVQVYLANKGQDMTYKLIDLWTDTTIDLSANNLTGDIPKELGYLKGLLALNLSHNHLAGNIPQEFGSLASLESLDLSCNQVEGRIPAALSELTFLGFLNLSNNNLSGRIPTERHFDTFDAASFLGNPKLCGAPLPWNCSDRALHEGNGSKQGNDSEQTVFWWESWIAGFGFGCAIGFGSVIGVLALSTRFRTKYFQVGDRFMKYFE